MRNLSLFLVMLLVALTSNAQLSTVAILSHQGEITTFYGSDGFKEAYAASEDGDIITLSSGTFASTDIKKGITVRGAGMMLEQNPTILTGSFKLGSPDGDVNNYLTMEGLRLEDCSLSSTLKNPTFLKCQFVKNFMGGETRWIEDGKFIHCIFKSYGYGTHDYQYPHCDSAIFQGCIFDDFVAKTDWNNFTLNNCIIRSATYTTTQTIYRFVALCKCVLKNCFVHYTDNSVVDVWGSKGTYMINCVVAGAVGNFNDGSGVNITKISSDINPFKNTGFYELKDEYAAEWLGDDGTQIGLYGGSLPFDPATTNPQISKFQVASKTTADGKLSVDIEVKGE